MNSDASLREPAEFGELYDRLLEGMPDPDRAPLKESVARERQAQIDKPRTRAAARAATQPQT